MGLSLRSLLGLPKFLDSLWVACSCQSTPNAGDTPDTATHDTANRSALKALRQYLLPVHLSEVLVGQSKLRQQFTDTTLSRLLCRLSPCPLTDATEHASRRLTSQTTSNLPFSTTNGGRDERGGGGGSASHFLHELTARVSFWHHRTVASVKLRLRL